jgi:hypothetical protein
MGSALAVDPDLPTRWRHDPGAAVEPAPVSLPDKAIASAASMARIRRQLRRLGAGRATRPGVNPELAVAGGIVRPARAQRRYRTWSMQRAARTRAGRQTVWNERRDRPSE